MEPGRADSRQDASRTDKPVRLWIDECLSPSLVDTARKRCEATCNEYRGLLHAKDRVLYAVVTNEEWIFVTNNQRDFLELAERDGLHPGLIVLPQRLREDQPPTLDAVLDYVELHSQQTKTPAAVWMTNRVVEYHDDDTISTGEWPATAT